MSDEEIQTLESTTTIGSDTASTSTPSIQTETPPAVAGNCESCRRRDGEARAIDGSLGRAGALQGAASRSGWRASSAIGVRRLPSRASLMSREAPPDAHGDGARGKAETSDADQEDV